MKKLSNTLVHQLITTLAILLITTSIFAQTPALFNYQGIAHGLTGPLVSQAITLKISIIDGSSTGMILYQERHADTTNTFGLYNVAIGGGTVINGSMNGVDWSSGNKYLKVEIDPNGGTTFTDLGTTQLLSVPYALYAGESASIGADTALGMAGGDLMGMYPNPSIADNAVTTSKIANAAITANKLHAMGASSGQALIWNGTAWVPTTISQGGATGTAGGDLSGTYPNPAIANNAVTTAKIANNAISTAKIATGAVDADKLANSSVTANKLHPMGAITGDVLKWDGNNWVPVANPGGWTLNGNVATNNSFIGTTNARDLRFKRNNEAVGYIDISNIAFGKEALSSNTTGSYNVAYGYQALFSNTEGTNNIANGHQTLYSNTEGSQNIAGGWRALYSNTTGNFNIANGSYALYNNTIGEHNIANGYNALVKNITGDYNIAIGALALYFNTIGFHNIANGYQALYKNTTGSNNLAIGVYALSDNTTGSNNIAAGSKTLYNNITGSNNSFYGTSAIFSVSASYDNSGAFGYNVRVTASNQYRIGSTSATSIGGQVSWTTVSDANFKTNVEENVPGLAFIKELRPVTYTMMIDTMNEFLNIKASEGEEIDYTEAKNVLHTGFISQEVEAAAEKLGYDFHGVDAPKNENDYYGLRYAEFVVPLVKGMQEQQEIIEAQNQRIERLERMLEELLNQGK